MGMLRKVEEKQSSYDELKGEWDMHSAGDLVMCLCDINGHIDGVHGKHCVGQRNLEERMLSEFCLEKELCV